MNKKMVILIAAIAIIVIGIIVGVCIATNSNSSSTEPTTNPLVGSQPETKPDDTKPIDPNKKSWSNKGWLSKVDPQTIAIIRFVEESNGVNPQESWKFDGVQCFFADSVVYIVTGESHKIEGSMSGMFVGLENLIEISGLENLDTSDVTDMSYMFADCKNLAVLQVNGLNTENVINAEAMFKNCNKLVEINMTGMDMRKAVDMDSIFSYCTSTSVINLPETRDVVSLSRAFESVGSSANPKTKINGMLDTHNCKDMSYMFTKTMLYDNDYSFVADFNTGNVITTERMFYECGVLEEINLSTWDTKNLKNTSLMFATAGSLKKCILNGWDMSSLEYCIGMFSQCSNLVDLQLGWKNVGDIKSAERMFFMLYWITEMDVSCFNGVTIENANEMFLRCRNLTTIYCDGFDANQSIDMFTGCSKLVGSVAYSDSKVDASMANLNGYFTAKN